MGSLVGIQIGAISFVDEGVDQVLDIVGEAAAVDAVFVATQSFDRGLQGRQVVSRPWPGHGARELDHHHVGGSYVTQHPEFYANTALGPFRAPDREVAGFDVLEQVIPAARRRGMRVYSFVLENTHSGLTRHVPNWPKVLQVDAWGRADPYACVRNPDYVAWWLGLIEDQLKSYPLDGLMFGSERHGPLGNVLGDGGFARDGNPYCFCPHCETAGHRRGIDVRRAREGYVALHRLAHGGADPGGDSGFVRFLRLLTEYPEILAWEQLWTDGFEALRRQLYGAAKFLAPHVQVGWHVWHHNSFSPLYRAQTDFTALAEYADFVKPVLYNNCAGYRLHHHIRQVARSIFAGVDEQTLYDLYRGVLGYDEAVRFDDLPATGLSADYVTRETRRTVAAVAGRAAVYPGLDLDVPTPEHVKKTSPEEVRASVTAALDGGADGIILSRKYSEMRLDNLAAVGDTLRARA
ncbi:hypothetical protein ACFYUR_26240 [Micromonospora haikouensis]|uniref:hypothetical protein n=1 Tax=Micromonospora TaxID=1873 RepID=UPI001E41CC8F|nr:hypothetical protein [Micromonospora sp. NBRC 110038]